MSFNSIPIYTAKRHHRNYVLSLANFAFFFGLLRKRKYSTYEYKKLAHIRCDVVAFFD